MSQDLRFPTDVYFYDTCSLLMAGETLFERDKPFIISSVTLKELERIKISSNKDPDIKYSARLITRLLEEHSDKYKIWFHKQGYEEPFIKDGFDMTDDIKILSDAVALDKIEDVVFVTNDLCLKRLARWYFGDGMIEGIAEDTDNYSGYKEVIADDEMMEKFYQDSTSNHFGLLIGQYLVLKNKQGEIIDLRVWTGEDHRFLATKPFKSQWFGSVSPVNNDIYQKMAFDSLRNNQVTMLKGPPGSGKSFCAMTYLFSELNNHNLDKIIIFCNPVATANSARLGFYPGDKNQKLLDSQIGNFLAGKLGDKLGVDQLINEEKIVLLPLADIRGYDTSGMRAGVYITEAQNFDRTLMKLALQRIGEDCKLIIDGDDKSQVDLPQYGGFNNGMRRASKILRGQDIYGEVELRTVHRSRLAKIAENI